jgi:pyruvate kinase
MLESMTNIPTPTRAEVSDVANAILDGTDTLMLSEETAIGKYPVEAVSMMTRIAEQVEGSIQTNVKEEQFRNISSTVSRSIWQIAESLPLDKVISITRTGYTAKVITRFKLHQPIIAITASKIVKNQLELYYGVQPIQFDYEKEKDRILSVAQMLHSKGILREDDTAIFTAGMRTSKPHASNLIEIHTIKELLDFRDANSARAD